MLVCDHDLNHDNNHKYRYDSVEMVDVQSISSVISKRLAFIVGFFSPSLSYSSYGQFVFIES